MYGIIFCTMAERVQMMPPKPRFRQKQHGFHYHRAFHGSTTPFKMSILTWKDAIQCPISWEFNPVQSSTKGWPQKCLPLWPLEPTRATHLGMLCCDFNQVQVKKKNTQSNDEVLQKWSENTKEETKEETSEIHKRHLQKLLDKK